MVERRALVKKNIKNGRQAKGLIGRIWQVEPVSFLSVVVIIESIIFLCQKGRKEEDVEIFITLNSAAVYLLALQDVTVYHSQDISPSLVDLL